MPPARTLFRRPGVAPMMLSGLIGRLPIGMVGLGLTLLVVGETGSYALAGAITATTTIGLAVFGPYTSRWADRFGQAPAIPLILSVHVTALMLLAASVGLGWATPLWFVLAAIAGMSMPALGAMTRARWVGIAANGAERSSAFAYEAVADEMAFVVGPVIATSLAVSFGPLAPILFGACALTVGGLALAAQRRTAPVPSRASGLPRTRGSVIRTPGIVSISAVMLAMGAMFGSLNVTTVAFAQQHAPGVTGLLLAAVSLGSLVSGVILSVTPRRWTLTDQVRASTVTLTIAIVPLAFISAIPVFAAMSFLLGLNFSVIMIGAHGLVERMTPRARITEALAVLGSAVSLGLAAGVTLAGFLIDARGPQLAFGLAAAFATTAAVVYWATASSVAALERSADAIESAALSGIRHDPAAPTDRVILASPA